MIYLDNAATSCPKPSTVIAAVTRALAEVCASPGRGAYEPALEAGRILLKARRQLARLLSARDPSRVVFTLNATHGLNLALKGLLAEGDHVVVSSLEHNAVWRPLQSLVAKRGIRVSRVPCGQDGETDPADVIAAIRADTRLVALTHASNVLGTRLAVEEIGPAVREREKLFLVDAAQTAGSYPIDVEDWAVDLLAVPGHKGLLGPQGVGALYVGERARLETLVEGGTGGNSESAEQPQSLPDRYEAGTPNTPGIAGLSAGLDLILQEGPAEIGRREMVLADGLRRRLAEIDGVRLYGPGPGLGAAPVVPVLLPGMSSAEAAFILDRAYGIAVRSGLHCAPEAHRVAGTLKSGLVRFSLGYFNVQADVDAAVEAVSEIAAKTAARREGP